MHEETHRMIREAIQLEVKGRLFFLHAAASTENAHGKKMFTRLADDETSHLKAFTMLFSELTGGEEWRNSLKEEEAGAEALVNDLKERMKGKEHQEGASEIEALSIGMQLEREAIDLFEKAAGELREEKAREICRRLAEIEKGHYDLLQAQYDSVTGSGFWFDSAEFKLDGQY